jgi:hypothetical protein
MLGRDLPITAFAVVLYTPMESVFKGVLKAVCMIYLQHIKSGVHGVFQAAKRLL